MTEPTTITSASQSAPAAVASPLTKLQRKAIAVCFTSDKVSVSEVQRKLSISYADAQTLCQSIVDLGLTDELELAPSLKQRGAPAPQAAPVAQGDALPREEFAARLLLGVRGSRRVARRSCLSPAASRPARNASDCGSASALVSSSSAAAAVRNPPRPHNGALG